MRRKRHIKKQKEDVKNIEHLIEMQYDDVFSNPLVDEGERIIESMLIPPQSRIFSPKSEISYYFQKYVSYN